jgi:hypothetical protein
MSIDGLQQRFEHLQRVEDEFRENAKVARRLLVCASRDRKKAYVAWQKAKKRGFV